MELNQIIRGDCLSVLSKLYAESGEFADLIITSPPYAQQRKDSYGKIPESDYPDWMLSVVRAGMKVLKPSGSFVINIKEHVKKGVRSLYVLETVFRLAKEFRYVDEFAWIKTNPFPTGNPKRLKDGFERCFHFTKAKKHQFFPKAVRTKSTSKWAGSNERGHYFAGAGHGRVKQRADRGVNVCRSSGQDWLGRPFGVVGTWKIKR